MMAAEKASPVPQRRKPAHPTPVERWNHPVVLMVSVGLRKPNAYHCLDNSTFRNALCQAWGRAMEWHVGTYMIMPDHLHFFCVPGQADRVPLDPWIRKWKAFVTVGMGRPDWRWLPGCWDTQMRGLDHYVEKRSYVRMNPVRKGLVDTPDAWPYQGEMRRIEW